MSKAKTPYKTADDFFFSSTGMNPSRVASLVDEALMGMDDGELYLEHSLSESLSWDDGKLKSSAFNTSQGFGLRSVLGESSAYAHSTELSESAIKRAVETVRGVRGEAFQGAVTTVPHGVNRQLYTNENPLEQMAFAKKIELLQGIDAYVRARDPRVKQVLASLSGEWQVVQILRVGGFSVRDVRPLVRLNIQVVAEQDGRMESGSYGMGGRNLYDTYIEESRWKRAADDALRQALAKLEAVPAPAGEMPVVLGPGWPGVLLHEAVGHGLEGDFNRKKTSVFSGFMGKQVAAKGVTVVDDGTFEGRRGSLTIDDEGTPTGRTTLIEDGILVGYLQDRLNARLMGVKPTGNGRRQSYAHAPMPRMTNTFMLAGNATVNELIAEAKTGIYAVNFGGGSVDITSGKFVFSASEAYKIENGKIGAPVKGVTLIGSGAETMKRIAGIGNDLELDEGIGTCGKSGQHVPVGVGQPSLLISRMTVGGTEA